MKRLLIVVGLLMFALPSLVSAQDDHTASKADLTFSEPIVIGGSTLSPGTYRFACDLIDGKHVMIVTALASGKEVVRVPAGRSSVRGPKSGSPSIAFPTAAGTTAMPRNTSSRTPSGA